MVRYPLTLAATAALLVPSLSAIAQNSSDSVSEAPAPREETAAAARELPSCGGIGASGEWAGGDAAGSDLSIVAEALDADGRISVQGRLVRAFTVGTVTDVRLEVAARPSGDSYLSILDEAGNEIAADDDSGGGYDARVQTLLQPGRYCALASSYDDAAIEVAIRLGRTGHEPLTTGSFEQQNASCEAAEPARLSEQPLDAAALAEGVAMTATVERIPAWRFELAEPAGVSVTARSAGGDPSIRLLDSDGGGVLAENDDADGLNSRIDLPDALPAGAYCLEVQDLNGSSNAVTVRLGAFDSTIDRLRRIDTAELSPLPADEVSVQELGPVHTSLTRDVFASATRATWLRFDLPEDGLLVLEAIGGQLDPVLVLFDRAGRRLDENDDGPDGTDSLLARRLPAGSYAAAVRLHDAGASGNVRILLERYVAAH